MLSVRTKFFSAGLYYESARYTTVGHTGLPGSPYFFLYYADTDC